MTDDIVNRTVAVAASSKRHVHRGQLQLYGNQDNDFEQHREARSTMCNWIQGRERVTGIEALMTALIQQLVSAVIEADCVFPQLYSGDDK